MLSRLLIFVRVRVEFEINDDVCTCNDEKIMLTGTFELILAEMTQGHKADRSAFGTNLMKAKRKIT